MKSNSKYHKRDAIFRLLELIEGTNEEIEISKRMNSKLMVKQAQHLKKIYTKELLELLKDYKLPIRLEAA